MKEIGLFPIFAHMKKAAMNNCVHISSVDMLPWDKFPEPGTVESRGKYAFVILIDVAKLPSLEGNWHLHH